MACDVEMDHLSGMQFDDEEDKELLKEQVDDGHEVAGPDVIDMGLEEGRPRLTGRMQGGARIHVPLHDPFGDLEAQLEQLPSNTFGTPKWILTCHLTNERNDLS